MARGPRGTHARFVIPAVVCLIWLLPSTATAQCWYEAGLYADLYDNGVDYVEVYGAGWDGSYCPPCGHTYRLDATLWFNGAVVDSHSYAALEGNALYNAMVSGWASYDVAFEIECQCAGPMFVGQVGGSREVQRSSPQRNLTITLNAFLPDQWVDVPLDFWESDRIWEGDNRGYDEFGSSRITLRPQISDPVNAPSSPALIGEVYRSAFLSQEFEKSTSLSSGNITAAAQADWNWGPPLKTRWGQAQLDGNDYCTASKTGAQVNLYCTMSIAHGIYPAWMQPDIQWDFNISFTYFYTTSTSVDYWITGCHTYFPAFEIYADGQRIYERPRAGIWSVNWPCGQAEQVNKSGTVTAQP